MDKRKPQNLWHKLTAPRSVNKDEAQQEYITKALLVILIMVGIFSSIVFMVSWLTGLVSLPSLMVIVIFNLSFLVGNWWLAYRGHWRVTSYLLPLMFFGVALQLNYCNGPGSVAMLQYAIVVLLVAMLHGIKTQLGVIGLVVGTYVGIGWMHSQGHLSRLRTPESAFIEWAVPFGGMLIFIALLQWFYTRQFQQTIAQSDAYATELTTANAQLEQEITERQKVEEERGWLHQQLIDAQKQIIQELSTPVIPVMDRIIIMPLVGSIDSMRARDIMRALLVGISQHRAKVVIVDITGVPLVDSGVASHLNKTIQAARLKGAYTIVTGISDAVAETIVDLDIDWSELTTLSDLQTGLVTALGSLGLRLERRGKQMTASQR